MLFSFTRLKSGCQFLKALPRPFYSASHCRIFPCPSGLFPPHQAAKMDPRQRSPPQGAQPSRGQKRPMQSQAGRPPKQERPDAPKQHGPRPHGGQQHVRSTGETAAVPAQAVHAHKQVEASFKTEQTFASLNLSAPTMKALNEVFGYSTMSLVQAATIPVALQGKDIVAKAKTGTGKTLAFLVPLMELLLRGQRRPGSVRSLVISPTRELAQQIESEAQDLGKFHGVRCASVVGGLSINKDLKNLQNGLDILIATPGRLKDLLENYDGIQVKLANLSYVCLDEADRLLDMGFKPDLDAIFARLPPPDRRQTVLFSATFPPDVQSMTARTLRKEHAVVNTIGDDDDQTHKHVVQESIVAPLEFQYHALFEVIRAHKKTNPNYKVIVFFTTARLASFSSRLFNAAGCPTMELHSRMSQSKRTKTTDVFRDGSKLVLFSSDVSARGMDFPGVSLIVQVGLTAQDQYVHRLGRTARAGNEGHGIIIVAPFETKFLEKLSREYPIAKAEVEPGSALASIVAGSAPSKHEIDTALATVDGDDGGEDSLKSEAEAAYRAWIGFYNGNLKTVGWDKPKLVEMGNLWAGMIGLSEIPGFEPKTVGKMGLKGIPGLRIERVDRPPQGQGGGRGGQGGGRGPGGGGGRGGQGGDRGGRPREGGQTNARQGQNSQSGSQRQPQQQQRGAGSFGGNRGQRGSFGSNRGGWDGSDQRW